MDTSETCIKMCDCSEIQKQWQSKVGDYYFLRKYGFEPTKAIGIYDGTGWSILPRDANYGWLPRQDQIQEMMSDCFKALLHRLFTATIKRISNDEIKIERKNEFKFCKSMEQLWLAFYMHEKYGKVWNGKTWITNTP